MNKHPRLWRAARNAVLLFGAFVLLSAGLIRIRQHVIRYRAEQLLSDIRGLELRKSTWADAQAVMRRWGAWGHYDGDCTSARCAYEIALSQPPNELIAFISRMEHPYDLLLLRPYTLIGGGYTSIQAQLTVIDGIVWGKSFREVVWVPPSSFFGNGFLLVGSVESVSKFDTDSRLVLHKNYLIGTRAGCATCQQMYAKFTPYASAADVQMLMNFNLSCITKWQSCGQWGDIQPEAWKQYSSEQPDPDRKCDYPLEVLGRDSDNAVVIEVTANQKDKDLNETVLTARLAQRLKGAEMWRPQTTEQVRVTGEDIFISAATAASMLPGTRFILLFVNDTAIPVPQDCGVIPFTPGNLAEIQRGIDQDFLSKRSQSPQGRN